MKFAPHGEGKPPPPTFTSVKDAIVLYFKQKQQIDVAVSLDKLTLVTIPQPIRPISTAADPDDKKEEQRGFDIDYKGDRDEWRARTNKLKDGMVSAYATIMTEYCTKTIWDRVEEHPGFESLILNDPIELLKAIKVLMHAPKRAQYPLLDWLTTLKRFLSTKQEPNELLSDYYKRFTQEYDTVKAMFGIRAFDYATEHLAEYISGNPAEQAALKKNIFAAFAGLLLVENSDHNKYGSLIEKMSSDFSLERDVYPRTKEKALDVLSIINWTRYILIQRRNNENTNTTNRWKTMKMVAIKVSRRRPRIK
jgi:hypothetical protein